MSVGRKYIFTMVNHITKLRWVVLLKDKTKKIKDAFRKCITIHNVPTTLQRDNGTEFEII